MIQAGSMSSQGFLKVDKEGRREGQGEPWGRTQFCVYWLRTEEGNHEPRNMDGLWKLEEARKRQVHRKKWALQMLSF